MIRAFITTWNIENLPNGQKQVNNPIVDYVDTLTNVKIRCSMFYPSRNPDGSVSKNRVLILVDGPPQIEQLANLAGVRMLPAYRFQKPISEIPQNVRDSIKTAIVNEGVPLSALSGIVVYGDFLSKVAKYFNVDFVGFGGRETSQDGDFG